MLQGRACLACYLHLHNNVYKCRALGSKTVPVEQFGGHSHWVWQTAYNPQHDSLLLSASSDAQVNLWYHGSNADGSSKSGSKATAHTGSSQSRGFGKEQQKGRAFTYDDHEDSVYCKSGCMLRMDSAKSIDSTLISVQQCKMLLLAKAVTACLAGAAWSCVDPWLFASLSYDGHLVANRVPNQTKYKVLL